MTTPEQIHLPETKNKTQVIKLAKAMFGPLARVRYNPNSVEVQVEKGGITTHLGSGPTPHDALRNALLSLQEMDKKGQVIDGVMTPVPGVNLVEEKRRTLVIKIPDVKPEVVAALYPNEVLEVFELVQMRDMEAIKPSIAKAVVRHEKQLTETARLKKLREELTTRLVAQKPNEAPGSDGHNSELFNIPKEDTTIVSGGGVLTKEMIEGVLR